MNDLKSTKKFACKKDLSFGMLVLISGLLIWALFILSFLTASSDPLEYIVPGLIAFVVSGFFLWGWMGTFYLLDKEKLTARSGPFRWKIPVQDIRYIRLNQKTIGGTWKPTLAWDCIEIRYGRSRAVFITPLDEKGFLSAVKDLNHDIQIKEK